MWTHNNRKKNNFIILTLSIIFRSKNTFLFYHSDKIISYRFFATKSVKSVWLRFIISVIEISIVGFFFKKLILHAKKNCLFDFVILNWPATQPIYWWSFEITPFSCWIFLFAQYDSKIKWKLDRRYTPNYIQYSAQPHYWAHCTLLIVYSANLYSRTPSVKTIWTKRKADVFESNAGNVTAPKKQTKYFSTMQIN